jgi:hypothetical protein
MIDVRLAPLRFKALLSILTLAALVAACSSSSIGKAGKSLTSKSGGGGNDQLDNGIGVDTGGAAALTDDEAMEFLGDNCNSCHASGQALHSTWPIPDKADLNINTLNAMDSIVDTYQALANKYTGAPDGTAPTAMPPSALDVATKAKLQSLLAWFEQNLPDVVKEAANTYGATTQIGSTLPVNMNYQCQQRASARNYMFRLFNDALGREPTADELSQNIPAAELDQPITDDRRTKLSFMAVEGPLKDEFINYGLKVFAQRIGGAGNIQPDSAFGITQDQVSDLQLEFWQLVKAHVADTTFANLLLMNKVMVTTNTHGFYDTPDAPCPDPGAGNWAECALSAKRSNFFGTVGFLKSTPSSFLESNNNYKRGGEIHAILEGERLMPQTSGPKGQTPDPIASCVTTQDIRVVPNSDPTQPAAPRGALAVPQAGAICEGCHLQKWLFAASFAFRPFDQNGMLIPDTAYNTANKKNPYKDLVTAATTGIMNNLPSGQVPVTTDVLKALMAETDQSMPQCLSDRTGKQTLAMVQTIGDLTKFMIGDGTILVHGLSRFIPSTLSNMPETNQDMITAISTGINVGSGLLLPTFKSYFESETFSCAQGGS